MIKTLQVSLGQVGVAQDPPAIGVPVVAPGQVLASGYYTDPDTDQLYYYNATLDQWYYYAAGLYYPLAISWKASPTAKIDLVVGDTLRFLLDFYYVGPLPVTKTFYAAVGTNKTSGVFEEWSGFNATKSWAVPSSDTPQLHTGYYVDLKIPSGHSGEDGAAYCKILDGITLIEGQNCTPYYYNVCHIIPAEGEFSEFSISKFEKVV